MAAFDSIFPCSPTSRSCIPQPGTANKIDILSYRQRLMHRLAYRNFGTPRIAGDQPLGRGRARHGRHPLVGSAQPQQRPERLPGGHVRPGHQRRNPPLDGQHCHGQSRQYRPGLQRLQRHQRLPRHALHRPSSRRPAGDDAAGRRHDYQRHRLADRHRSAGATTLR